MSVEHILPLRKGVRYRLSERVRSGNDWFTEVTYVRQAEDGRSIWVRGRPEDKAEEQEFILFGNAIRHIRFERVRAHDPGRH